MPKKSAAWHREQAEALLLSWYKDGSQNGQPYKVNTMFTHGRGSRERGLADAQAEGWIVSTPDSKFNKTGWRHDLTMNGRIIRDILLRKAA